MRTIFMLVIVMAVLCSCNSTRLYQDVRYPKLSNENLANLNGVYDRGLWDQLRPTNVKANDHCVVRLTVVDKRRIKAELMVDNGVVSSATLRGKLRKNGYYSINPCINMVPTPFYFLFSRSKQDIIVTEKNDLHVAYSKYGISVIMLMSAGREDRGSAVYERRQ